MKNTVSRVNQVPGDRRHAEFHKVGLEHGLQQEVGDELEHKHSCLKAGLKFSYTNIFGLFGNCRLVGNAKIG